MKVLLSRRADSDLARIVSWLESRQTGLGDEFIGDLLDTLAVIGQHPVGYQETKSGLRRARTERFPYLLYYSRSGQGIEIVAIVHTRQDRSEWEVHDEPSLYWTGAPNVAVMSTWAW